jgi:hypothetical protein
VSAWQAVGDLIKALGSVPVAVLPAGHASLVRPGAPADLPAIVVTADDVSEQAAGVGGLVRSRSPEGTPVTATRCSGALALELWAADQAAIIKLADATFEALAPTADAVSKSGFLRLAVRAIGPVMRVPLDPAGPATALRMAVGCSFAHETSAVEAVGGGAIKTVFVDMQDGLHEVMELGAPLTADERAALIHQTNP